MGLITAILGRLVILPTIILAILFGVTWPLAQAVKRRVDNWKQREWYWHGLYLAVILFVLGLIVLCAVWDWLVNWVSASIVYWAPPHAWNEFLTQRIQIYLYAVSRGDMTFNALQWVYTVYVVLTANHFDRSPHFNIPNAIKDRFRWNYLFTRFSFS